LFTWLKSKRIVRSGVQMQMTTVSD